jgi:hypothetical protein
MIIALTAPMDRAALARRIGAFHCVCRAGRCADWQAGAKGAVLHECAQIVHGFAKETLMKRICAEQDNSSASTDES